MNNQTTKSLIMIRPANFNANNQTRKSNAFQSSTTMPANIQKKVQNEFANMVKILQKNAVDVIVIEDTPLPQKPDAVFLNNWFSTHDSGVVVLYPLEAENRRKERRLDIFDTLINKHLFLFSEITNLSLSEHENRYLEGTGSVVLDRKDKLAYMCYSSRSYSEVLDMFCRKLGYEAVSFHAYDENSNPIYHTNVMMSIGDKFAVICEESIKNAGEHERVINSLKNSSREIVNIDYSQLHSFAGNVLEIRNEKEENLLVISQQAFNSLNSKQITQLEKYVRLVPIAIPNIELYGGGSVRCMIAENFLPHENDF
ncbi:citrulline utilization hydrolase CtlX [Candidatus Uabimicrobium sp. HlEnr_7]|uniref:citrulline utilization hydrolase CtlX n=1 Tax=Candidatus Uabimicrobium helgolandensis TaxID=3095367 RepID=UPI0035578CA8